MRLMSRTRGTWPSATITASTVSAGLGYLPTGRRQGWMLEPCSQPLAIPPVWVGATTHGNNPKLQGTAVRLNHGRDSSLVGVGASHAGQVNAGTMAGPEQETGPAERPNLVQVRRLQALQKHRSVCGMDYCAQGCSLVAGSPTSERVGWGGRLIDQSGKGPSIFRHGMPCSPGAPAVWPGPETLRSPWARARVPDVIQDSGKNGPCAAKKASLLSASRGFRQSAFGPTWGCGDLPRGPFDSRDPSQGICSVQSSTVSGPRVTGSWRKGGAGDGRRLSHPTHHPGT